MAARSGTGIPGIGVLLVAAGSFFVFVGIRNVGVVDGLREIIKGKVPAERPSTGGGSSLPAALEFGSTGGTGGGYPSVLGGRIAAEAKRWLGVPYRWGGNTPDGWDCSGYVTYVLRRVGVQDLPGSRPTSYSYLTWRGARTVSRSEIAPGDLLCWPGHIGIAVSATEMANAPSFGIPTRVQKIYWPLAPRVRRVNGV